MLEDGFDSAIQAGRMKVHDEARSGQSSMLNDELVRLIVQHSDFHTLLCLK